MRLVAKLLLRYLYASGVFNDEIFVSTLRTIIYGMMLKLKNLVPCPPLQQAHLSLGADVLQHDPFRTHTRREGEGQPHLVALVILALLNPVVLTLEYTI